MYYISLPTYVANPQHIVISIHAYLPTCGDGKELDV